MEETVAAVPGPAGAAAPPAPAVARADGKVAFQHHSGIVPQLQNVVSTVNVGCKLDLASIAQRARNAEYNPKRFAACIVRIREPKTTALMFSSGKMVIAGARSEEQSKTAAKKYTKILSKLGYQTAFSEFNVQNMVASCSVEFPIRLEGLAAHFEMFVHYEPEVFPGLVFRMRSPKVVLLIFVTGKVVITGAKKVEDIYEAFSNIYGVLQDHRKGDARRLVRPAAATDAPAASAITNGDEAGPSRPAQPAAGMPGLDMMGNLTLPPTNVPPPTLAAGGLPPATPATGLGIPPPTPAVNQIPPPTPAAGNIPPPTPAAGNIPPPTPAAGIVGIPPPTPATGLGIPPPTPAVAVVIPPPTPLSGAIPPPVGI